MYFSKDKWNNGREMDSIIPVSSALSFEKVVSSLRAADELYLAPVFGSRLLDEVESLYAVGVPSPTFPYPIDALIRLFQTAEANLAFYANFDALQLRITDQGFQRQRTENFGSPYKYQEDRLRQTFKNRGFNAIDRLLDFLDAKFRDFPGYAEMPALVSTRTDIVQRTSEVDRVHFINGSRLVFLRLVPIMRAAVQNELRPLLGWQLYTRMQQSLEAGTSTAEVPVGETDGYLRVDSSRTYEELRQQCIPFVVKKAVAQLFRETGSLTDRGLYYGYTQAGMTNNEGSVPATHGEAHASASTAEAEAVRNAETLTAFVEWKWPEYFSGHQSGIFKRDNTDKKTFWA